MVTAATIPDVDGTDVGLVARVVGGGMDVGVGGPAAMGDVAGGVTELVMIVGGGRAQPAWVMVSVVVVAVVVINGSTTGTLSDAVDDVDGLWSSR